MSDKRKVATDALETLGTIIDDKQKRDAIHLAVEPVIAAEPLYPGDHITVIEGKAYKRKEGQGLGIVDPFLIGGLSVGDRFWFVMYPRMVHSLRHVWAHPAFPDEVKEKVEDKEKELLEAKKKSEKWLRDFIDNAHCPSYEAVMEAIREGSSSYGGGDGDGYYIYIKDGNSIHVSGWDAGGYIPDEFWDHVEIVLGRKINNRPDHFSCSC